MAAAGLLARLVHHTIRSIQPWGRTTNTLNEVKTATTTTLLRQQQQQQPGGGGGGGVYTSGGVRSVAAAATAAGEGVPHYGAYSRPVRMILEHGAGALKQTMTSNERRKLRRQAAKNDDGRGVGRVAGHKYAYVPPMVSALEAARARKVFRSNGWAWPGEEEEHKKKEEEQMATQNGKRSTPAFRMRMKGHKHDVAREVRKKDIEQRMSKMDETIARYRSSRRRGAAGSDPNSAESIYDELFLTAKERRVKEKRKMQLKAIQQGGGK